MARYSTWTFDLVHFHAWIAIWTSIGTHDYGTRCQALFSILEHSRLLDPCHWMPCCLCWRLFRRVRYEELLGYECQADMFIRVVEINHLALLKALLAITGIQYVMLVRGVINQICDFLKIKCLRLWCVYKQWNYFVPIPSIRDLFIDTSDTWWNDRAILCLFDPSWLIYLDFTLISSRSCIV